MNKTQITARLRLLSGEECDTNLPEKSGVIEKWLTAVQSHSKEWVDAETVHIPVIEETSCTGLQYAYNTDSGIDTDNVNGSISVTVTKPRDMQSATSESLAIMPCDIQHTTVIVDRCVEDFEQGTESRTRKATPVISRTKTSKRCDHPPSVRVYRQQCRKLKILPLRRVLGQFGRHRILLNDLCLSLADVQATCRGLMLETTADYLDISGNSLGHIGCEYVLKMLSEKENFKEVRIADNLLTGPGIMSVMKHFEHHKVITVLDISGNRLTDRDGNCIANIIKTSTQLHVLHVHHNELQGSAGTAIGKAIAVSTNLVELDISWNHLRQRGAIGFAKGLEKNSSLEFVNIGWNGFGFEGCVALSDALLHNIRLEKLDLTCNRIHPPALIELMKGLLYNKVLRVLILDRNPITPSFATFLLEGIQRSRNSVLEELSLQGVVVDRNFQKIAETIRQERSFVVLYEMSLPVTCRDRSDMLREIEMKNSYNLEPLRLLYLLKERNRAQDFFHKINKDHNDVLTPDELSLLFKESGIPVSKYVIDRIIKFMDTDKDGRIDLGEFLIGDKKIKKISRNYARQLIGGEYHYSRYSRTFRQAHIHQQTSRLKVDDANNYLSPIISLTPSPASSRRSSYSNL